MLLIVDDSFELSSQNATFAEKAARADTWARVLFGIVPEDRLQNAFDRAFRDHDSSFPVNAYDIKTAWEKIRTEEYEAEKTARLAECPNDKYHIGETASVVLMNPHTQEDELYPCPKCRPEEFENKKKTDIALYGEIKPFIEIKPDTLGKSFDKTYATAKKEYSLEEIAALKTRHNELVREIVETAEAQNALLIDWDAGANCFVRRHRRAMTFSVEIITKCIEDYQKIKESREMVVDHFAN